MIESKPQPSIKDRAPLDPATLRVLSDPLRSFVVYSLVTQAKTVRQLAAELGCPPTRLYYHMQQLEKHGLVVVENTRMVSGIVEKHYRAAARELFLDRSAFTASGTPDRSRVEALLGFVFDQSRVEIQRQIEAGAIDLNRSAPEPGALIAYRNVLKLDARGAARLYARLKALWDEYDALAKSPAADGQFYAFAVALYPNAVASEPPSPAGAGKPASRRKRNSA
ncbi:MAG: helix-turn-helix domain-containing protein [Pseudomarimonas sp.]